MIRKSAIVVVGCIGLLNCTEARWPESGEREVRELLEGNPAYLGCYMSIKMKEHSNSNEKTSSIKDVCFSGDNTVTIIVQPEYVRGVRRCGRSNIVTEYSVTSFRYDDARDYYGRYYCTYYHGGAFKEEIGSLTDARGDF